MSPRMVVTDEPRTTSFHSNKYARQVLGQKIQHGPGRGCGGSSWGRAGPEPTGPWRGLDGPWRPWSGASRFVSARRGGSRPWRAVYASWRPWSGSSPPLGPGEPGRGRGGPFRALPGHPARKRSAPDQPGPAGRGRRNLRGCSRSERAAGVLSPHASCGCLTRLSEPAVRGHLAARTGGRHPAPGGPPKGAAREVTFPRWIFWRPGTLE